MGPRKNRLCEADTHTQGERDHLPKRPMKMVFTPFLRAWKTPIGWEASKGIRMHTI